MKHTIYFSGLHYSRLHFTLCAIHCTSIDTVTEINNMHDCVCMCGDVDVRWVINDFIIIYYSLYSLGLGKHSQWHSISHWHCNDNFPIFADSSAVQFTPAWLRLGTGPCGRCHLALALLTIIKRDRYASECPLRKFATVFSQLKTHYGRQMWYQNDQKSVKFNIAVIVC